MTLTLLLLLLLLLIQRMGFPGLFHSFLRR